MTKFIPPKQPHRHPSQQEIEPIRMFTEVEKISERLKDKEQCPNCKCQMVHQSSCLYCPQCGEERC